MLVRLLINGVRKNTTTSTEVEELVTELEYPRFTIQVEYLEDLKKTVKTGSAVPFSRNASAKKMIRDLVSEMIELLDMPYQKEGRSEEHTSELQSLMRTRMPSSA